jgi:hypothetical protein
MNLTHAEALELPSEIEAALIHSARDPAHVDGYTHNFYRYPARFSPVFVRAFIDAFSAPGDTVLDPYMGGGTSIVEAIASGRNAVGVDISQLAEFVSSAKATVYTRSELDLLSKWGPEAAAGINMRALTVHFDKYEQLGYYKHLDGRDRWRLRRCIEQCLGAALTLPSARLEAFARCAILRTAQWALDGRRSLPTVAEFRQMLPKVVTEMIRGAAELADDHSKSGSTATATLFNRSAVGLEDHWPIALPRPKLVITSPPYPGVHVLYHRWQVDGRKETAAPFWIANKLDGSGASYYTMGDRKSERQDVYFENILTSTKSIVKTSSDEAIFVQMVAFSRPDPQLNRFLEAMSMAGLTEFVLPSLSNVGDGRLWRSVPGRKWYAHKRGDTPSSREVVLLHRKSVRHAHPTNAALEASSAGSSIGAQ